MNHKKGTTLEPMGREARKLEHHHPHALKATFIGNPSTNHPQSMLRLSGGGGGVTKETAFFQDLGP